MKYCKYFVRKNLAMIFLVMFTSLQGMEVTNNQNISILAYNNDQGVSSQLNNYAAYSEGKVGIFGATPRYSLFRKYCVKILQNYKLAVHMKKENANQNARKHAGEVLGQPFRHVFTKKISFALRPFLADLPRVELDIEAILQKFQLHQEEECVSFSTLINMFLTYAIDHRTILRNIQSLVDTTHANQGTQLMHVLLPTYFAGVDNLSSKAIRIFLNHCKHYYQELYQQIELPENMKVSIVIPSIEYFNNFVSNRNAYNPVTCIGDIIYKEVIRNGVKYAFMNQDQDENNALCSYFNDNYHLSIDSIPCVTYDNYGNQAGKNFTPYVINADMQENFDLDYDSIKKEIKKSQLLNSKTCDYLQTNIFNLKKG